MKNKKVYLVIMIILVFIVYLARQGYYYMGYLDVMDNAIDHVKPEYINAKERDYTQNQSFDEISIDTNTVTNEILECEKNEINYSCKKDNMVIFYNSGKDNKISYEEEEINTFGGTTPFYKYQVKSKDIINYFKKNKIEKTSDLLMDATKKDYIKVNFLSTINNIKEATTFNLLKSISVPKHDRVYIVTKGQNEFRVYSIEDMYVLESTLDERGFFIVLNKIPDISIDKVVNLIESIKYIN